MDSSFKLAEPKAIADFGGSFNPCFNGLVVQTKSSRLGAIQCLGFNPCFNGLVVQTYPMNLQNTVKRQVSILVLMDSSFKLLIFYQVKSNVIEFQSLF